MKFNPEKFQLLRIRGEIIKITPDLQFPIEEVDIAKDLGIYLDNNLNFYDQRMKIVTKTQNKCSWILRTFFTRDLSIMRTLWKTLVQPIQDYASVVWPLR